MANRAQTLPGFLRPDVHSSLLAFQNKVFEMQARLEGDRIEDGYYNPNSRFSTHQACAGPNKNLNRYTDILPYNHSRVVVDGPQTYINANRITAPPTLRNSLPTNFPGFIATQAPLPETQPTFWKMVQQQNVHIIVCLTAVDPNRRRRAAKAEQYWPQAGQTDNFDDSLSVRNLDSNYSSAEVVYRNLELWNPLTSEPRRRLLLVHYQGWPDHGVPQSTDNIRNILYSIRNWKFNEQTINNHNGDFGPMLVHCSAGCGRTGTFCVIDTALSVLEHVGYPYLAPHPLHLAKFVPIATQENVQMEVYDWNTNRDLCSEILDAFRNERVLMVQTSGQFRFCYKVIADLCQ
ncbi:hypothetical protein FBU30_002163 [Linnemannia zychae]|nr:hypothetical protein FBU30_002163 [Linnemannia zychae]